jgi:farnesyl-diphosphate farnesyltransferase
LIHVARRLLENVRADRRRPPLARLDAILEGERFAWSILPYAARTFSFCIALLPRRTARPLAVAYLYCRMLDTCEDLPRDAATKEAALRAFLDRFGAGDSGADALRPAPLLAADLARDERDRVYLLLLARAERVDRFFLSLPAPQRAVILRLVRRMGEGMIWAVRTFESQRGALDGEAQLSRYCFEVLGNPMLFAEEMQRLEMGLAPEVGADRKALAAEVGEAIQLANVARDLEKDCAAGVFYLRPLQQASVGERPAAIAAARRQLLQRAVVVGRAFRPYMAGIPSPRVSLARGAGLLMALFTLGFWQGTARRLGLAAFPAETRITRMRALRMVVRSVSSRAGNDAVLAQVERSFGDAAARLAIPSPAVDLP